MQHLEVKGEAIDPPCAQHEFGHIGPERLAPTLGIAIVAEEKEVGRHIDHPASQRPKRRRFLNGGGVVVMPVANHHVIARLNRVDESNELIRRVGEVSISERDRSAVGGRNPRPHPPSLA